MNACGRCGGSVLPDGYGDLRCSMCSRPVGPQDQPRLETPVATWDKMRMTVVVPAGADDPPPTVGDVEACRRREHCRGLLKAGLSVDGAARESGVSRRTAYRIARGLKRMADQDARNQAVLRRAGLEVKL